MKESKRNINGDAEASSPYETQTRKSFANKVLVLILVIGLVLTGFGSWGYYDAAQAFSQKAAPTLALSGDESSRIVAYNDELSYYLPKSENIVTDESTGINFVNNELLIMFETGTSVEAAEGYIKELDGETVGYVAAINRYEVRFPEIRTLDELETLIATAEQSELVAYAYTNYLTSLSPNAYTPSDGEWIDEWNTPTTPDGNWGMEAINAPELWDYRDNMAPVRVGVLDGGFYEHEDVVFRELLSPNKEDDHGTHVAGTIGATHNDIGVAGVSPTAQIYGVSFGGMEGEWELSEDPQYGAEPEICLVSVAQFEVGLVFLVDGRGCKVINMSYGYGRTDVLPLAASRGNQEALNFFKKTARPTKILLSRLIENGYDFLFVAAAGNENETPKQAPSKLRFIADANARYGYVVANVFNKWLGERGGVDAAFASQVAFIGSEYDTEDLYLTEKIQNHLMVVGAAGIYNGSYKIANFSNHGSSVDIVAPGVEVESTTTGTSVASNTGTSMAAPHVTGTAAALWAMDPSLSAVEIRQIILDTAASPLGYVGSDVFSDTYPFLDAGAAADRVNENLQKKRAEEVSKNPGVFYTEGNTVLTLCFDVSGSMGDQVAKDQGTKMDAAKKSGMSVVSTIQNASSLSNWDFSVGLVQFSGSAKTAQSPTTNYSSVNSAISALKTSGGTDIYEGLKISIEQAERFQGNRFIILLSDGENNGGKTSAEIIELAKEAAKKNIRIYTVGFAKLDSSGKASGIDEDLLKQIAQATGGTYKFSDVDNGMDLVSNFIELKTAATATVLHTERASVRAGETSPTATFEVPQKSGDLEATLAWPGSTLNMRLYDPNGTLVDENYPGVTVFADTILAQVFVVDPLPGTWSYQVFGEEVSLEQEPYFAIASFKEIFRGKPVSEMAPFLETPPARGISLFQNLAAVSLPLGVLAVVFFCVVALSRSRSKQQVGENETTRRERAHHGNL